ncbi:uncharacterized protein LOC132316708 [Cornus florida]|uniref:uncharacterized protein LOC132316708 n=1 Tax=Cornus florida TaxID=4283 RepID=UPI00289A7EC5|nr:uncharacterized protein LOC132316708 [Cornus florida]
MKLFSNTLTETAFKWYLNLPQNSIHTWEQMQDVFHDQFYWTKPEVSMSDLSRIHQLPNDDVKTFLARFKKARNRCQLLLPEEDGVQPSSSAAKRNIFEAGKQYAFDISKAEQIFDHLLSDKIIKVTRVHKIPSADEIKGREYCKYHNSWNHATNNCVVFRNVIRAQIEKGAWKFPEKKKEVMSIDSDPFPALVSSNMVEISIASRPRRRIDFEDTSTNKESKAEGKKPND